MSEPSLCWIYHLHFDTVDHQTLLSILQECFAVTNSALNWFRSYLTGRSGSVHLATDVSDAITVNCGVPQGSWLGAELFTADTEELDKVWDQHHMNRAPMFRRRHSSRRRRSTIASGNCGTTAAARLHHRHFQLVWRSKASIELDQNWGHVVRLEGVTTVRTVVWEDCRRRQRHNYASWVTAFETSVWGEV